MQFDNFNNIQWDTIHKKLSNAKFITIKEQKEDVQYLDLSLSFDTETTSTYIEPNGIKEKFAFMYVWQFGIDGYYCYGRTWEEFIHLCKFIQSSLNLNDKRRVIIFIHNLSFEFQFFRKYFDWLNVFATRSRNPIKALTSYGIEFRDSLILSGYKLANVAKNLTSHKIPKMVGDLDYSLTRTKDTTFSKKELGYMLNDVRILIAYIDEQRKEYGDITKIPLTNTGRVRRYVRNECFKEKFYQRNIKALTIKDENEYLTLKQAFAGGFTHANPNHVGKKYHNIASFDFTSSYPTVMIAEQYPSSKAIPQKWVNWKRFNEINEKALQIFTVEFTGLQTKVYFDNYISKNKCLDVKGEIENNGRIFSADYLKIIITSVDWDIIKQVYSWKTVKISNQIAYYKDYLPKPIIQSILHFYKKKTTLKHVKGKEAEYMHGKGMLNSCYGMAVTDIVHDEEIYSGDYWYEYAADGQKEIDNYNKSYNRFLYYPWGVFVTAYARHNLWSGILEFKDDYIYSDTDSIKAKNYKKHMNYIDGYNQEITNKLEKCLDHYGIDKSELAPLDVDGIAHPLGLWDFEGVYKTFKTLGAKRYIVETSKGKLEITIAGLPKDKGRDYLLKVSNNDMNKVFQNFTDKMKVPADDSGKMTAYYDDEEKTAVIKDYQGHYTEVTSRSSVHLSKASFEMTLAEKFIKLLEMLADGEQNIKDWSLKQGI